jgi:hypothetical protein
MLTHLPKIDIDGVLLGMAEGKLFHFYARSFVTNLGAVTTSRMFTVLLSGSMKANHR